MNVKSFISKLGMSVLDLDTVNAIKITKDLDQESNARYIFDVYFEESTKIISIKLDNIFLDMTTDITEESIVRLFTNNIAKSIRPTNC